MRFLLTATALLLLLSCPACHKKGTRGRVLEYGTDQPIKNATVILSECESDGNFSGNINCFEVGRTTTDADGYWSFESDGFTVGAEAPRYWSSDDDYQVISGDGKPIDLYLYPYAWLRVVLRNASGAYLISAPGPFLTSTRENLYLNQNEEVTFILLREGNKDYKYIFGILDQPDHVLNDFSKVFVDAENTVIHLNQNTSPLSFEIFLPGHDTTTVTITY